MFHLLLTTKTFHLLFTTETFYLLLTSETFRILLTYNMFYLILTTKTFYLFSTTKTFYSLLTTKTFYFSKTTAATYVCTHSQRSKPVSHPHSCTYTEHTLARVSHSASQPPNSQMPGVGARAAWITQWCEFVHRYLVC